MKEHTKHIIYSKLQEMINDDTNEQLLIASHTHWKKKLN